MTVGHAGFPGSGQYTIVVDSEHMRVTAGAGSNSVTVTRAFDGTSAASHADGATVYLAPTRLQMINGFFEETRERYNPTEQRNSFERFYRSDVVAEKAALKGLTAPATYEDWAWWCQLFLKGSVAGVLSDTAAYTYTFVPTLNADDLSTARFVTGNDTAAYALPFSIGDQLKYEAARGGTAAMGTFDFLSARQVSDVFPATPLSQRVVEDVVPANTVAYIDSTTIGSTAAGNVVRSSFTLANSWQQLFFLNGLLYPTDAARATRFLDVEIDVVFNGVTEYNAAIAGTERKIRTLSTGSAIAGTGGPTYKSLLWDVYTYWDTFPFQIDTNVWQVKFKGRSVYDASAAQSFKCVVVNGLATLV